MQKVFMPATRLTGVHKTDRTGSFAGMVYEWWKMGLCEIHDNPTPWFWWGEVGDVLLHYRPTLETMPARANYRLGLFANASPPVNGRINVPWTFWASVPSRFESYRSVSNLPHDKRPNRFVFIGSYENLKQRGNRPIEWWEPALDLCEYSKVKAFTNKEYLRTLRQSRFGLCLPGYGPKCWRDVEYLGMGVVPVFTPGCSLEYWSALTPGLHYYFAKSPDEALSLIESTTPERWAEMSEAGKAWYERHCSPLGSFMTTHEIVEANP